jgi:hypothetical protein
MGVKLLEDWLANNEFYKFFVYFGNYVDNSSGLRLFPCLRAKFKHN